MWCSAVAESAAHGLNRFAIHARVGFSIAADCRLCHPAYHLQVAFISK
jgi:hypothetical protein